MGRAPKRIRGSSVSTGSGRRSAVARGCCRPCRRPCLHALFHSSSNNEIRRFLGVGRGYRRSAARSRPPPSIRADALGRQGPLQHQRLTGRLGRPVTAPVIGGHPAAPRSESVCGRAGSGRRHVRPAGLGHDVQQTACFAVRIVCQLEHREIGHHRPEFDAGWPSVCAHSPAPAVQRCGKLSGAATSFLSHLCRRSPLELVRIQHRRRPPPSDRRRVNRRRGIVSRVCRSGPLGVGDNYPHRLSSLRPGKPSEPAAFLAHLDQRGG